MTVSKVTNLEEVTGSLASSYRSTIEALHQLLQTLNKLETQNKLPADHALTERITGGLIAIELALLHFPDLEKKWQENDITKK